MWLCTTCHLCVWCLDFLTINHPTFLACCGWPAFFPWFSTWETCFWMNLIQNQLNRIEHLHRHAQKQFYPNTTTYCWTLVLLFLFFIPNVLSSSTWGHTEKKLYAQKQIQTCIQILAPISRVERQCSVSMKSNTHNGSQQILPHCPPHFPLLTVLRTSSSTIRNHHEPFHSVLRLSGRLKIPDQLNFQAALQRIIDNQ